MSSIQQRKPVEKKADEGFRAIRSWVVRSGVSAEATKDLLTIINCDGPRTFYALSRIAYDEPIDEQQAIVFYHQKLMEERIAQGNQKIESRLSHMDSAIGKMAKDIRCLMKTKSQSRNGRVKSFDVFPITSMDALDALMSRMEEEEDLHLFVKNTITRGGDNKANLLKKTLSDDLANKFNATGRFGKMKAMDHGFFQLLFECWEEENFNERDFAAFIKKCGHNRSSRYFKKSLQRVVSTTFKTVDEDDYK